MTISQREQQRDLLLGLAISSVDIPNSMYELAIRRYEDVGRWLALCAEQHDTNGEVYPQGSFRLGTVVRPIGRDQYDIDMVYRWDVTKESVTQAYLKADVGDHLDRYVNGHPEGRPRLEERTRCWTLVYTSEPFHMDILPTIPDPKGSHNSVLLTDRTLKEWQHSNPIGYSQWFPFAVRR